MKAWLMAFRMLAREWRSGEIRIMLLALTVATASLVSVSALADRFDRAFQTQGTELLGADLVVRMDSPPPRDFIAEARRRELAQTLTTSFHSVVLQRGQTLLTDVKAVGPGYPLRGKLSVSMKGESSRNVTGPPAAGAVWVDSQFLARLHTSVGRSINLGTKMFTLSGVITFEPDRGGVALDFAPRVMMNQADLDATGLIGPGSRVDYRWMLAGKSKEIDAMRHWLRVHGVAQNELQDARNASPRFRSALDRGARFLALATLIGILLAGIAISRATGFYARRHFDHAAILRCLGATQSEISRIYIGQLVALSLVGGLVGSALGYLAQQALLWILPSLVHLQLPWPSARPLLAGMAASLVVVMGFGLPAVARLRDVPAMRVIRRELGPVPPRVQVMYGAAAVAVTALVFWMAADARLAAWVVAGAGGAFVILALVAAAMIRGLGRWRGGLGASWRFGIGSLVRRRGSTVAQVVGLGIGVMGLLLLTVVRTDLFDSWRQHLPAATPNHFLINIQSDQAAGVKRFLAGNRVEVTRVTPLVRARLIAIGGRPIDPDSFKKGFARHMVERAANLSWLDKLPDDNRLVAGHWWKPDQWQQGLVSVEKDYARALGLSIGDVLTYRVADKTFDVRVASLRKIEWNSFRPNFFLLVPPDLLRGFPKSYITSFYLPSGRAGLITRLIERYPNVTDIDVDAIVQQVRRLIDRLDWAVQFIFVFALAAGALVLMAGVQTTRDERRREIAVLKALGAGRRQLAAALLSEFGALGVLAGLIGAVAAGLIGLALARFLFDISYHFDIPLWLIGAVGGGACIALVGYLASLPDIRATTWQVLRQSE